MRRRLPEANVPFETCVVIRNPHSTNATGMDQRIVQLRKFFPDDTLTVLYTSPDGREANRNLLRDNAGKLDKQTLIAVAAGDGTVNFVVDALLNDAHFTEEQRQAAIFPLWGGNGNDLACMLNGSGRAPLERVFQTGERIGLRPLMCEITTEDGISTKHTAICYASFGASAYAAKQLEAERGSKSLLRAMGITKFMHELGLVSRAMRRASRFLIEDPDSTRIIYDRLFINGTRFAKVAGMPQRLDDRHFLHITVEQKRVSSLAFHISELIRKHPDQYIVPEGNEIAFTLQESTWGQIDGEVVKLAAGTRIRIAMDSRPFYAFSTLLAKKPAISKKSESEESLTVV